MTAVIRPAGAADAETLALVGQATFLDTYAGVIDGANIVAHCRDQHGPAVYQRWLRAPSADLWLAESGTAPIGYAVLDTSTLPVADPSADDLELKRIYVLSRFQGQGVGAALMEAALGAARRRGAARLLLGVYALNVTAIGFYERMGFQPAGRRRFQVGATLYDDLILGRAVAASAVEPRAGQRRA